MKHTLALLCMMSMLAFTSYGQLIIDGSGQASEDFSSFDGSGFDSPPGAGELSSDAWAITGFSDGDLAFGGTETSGDYARGTTSGYVSAGGVYKLDDGPGFQGMFIQSGGSDFTPGTLTLKICNQSGGPVINPDVLYTIFYNNNEDRANSMNFSYSTDDVSYTSVAALDFTSPEQGEEANTKKVSQSTILPITVNNTDCFYLRWSSDDVSGSGGRDEIGIGEIQVGDLCAIDITPPSFTSCPFDFYQGTDPGNCTATSVYPTPTATDFCSGPPSSDLGLGDISFTGYHADNAPAEFFSFVIWPAIPAGTQITFTDNGWYAAGGLATTEGTATWTATSNMPEGSEVIITNNSPSTGTWVQTSTGAIAFPSSGDQIFAYQGTTPTGGDMSNFLAAIQMNGSWDGDRTSTSTSAKPPIFTDGVNSISISPEVDNAVYDCSTTGPGRADAQPEVLDAFNWNTNNGSGLSAPTCGFSLPSNALSVIRIAGPASGGVFDPGINVVTYEATDGAGNTNVCSFKVTIVDEEDPSIFCPPSVTVDNDEDECGAVVNYADPTAADNCNVVPPTNILGLGDIAFTGYSSDGTDSYSFVIFKSIASGTSITFTDNRWNTVSGLGTTEGTHTWTSASNLPAGTEVHVSGSSVNTGSIAGSSGPNLSAGGDQIFAYQGSAPTTGDMSNFLAAIQMNGDWDVEGTSSNTSAKPAIFTDGVNSISIDPEIDNAIYDCSTTTGPDAASIRAAINDASNWTKDNSNNLPCPTCGFTVPVAGGSISANLIAGLPSGSLFPVGTTSVTFEAVDGNQNSADCSFDVTVNDTTAPEITCPAAVLRDITIGCTDVVNYEVTATDQCVVATGPTTDLVLGDIAFTGYRGDNPDSLSFVAFVTMDIGTEIEFTDNGWFAAGGFRTNEGILTWTANAIVPAGTEVLLAVTSGSLAASTGTLSVNDAGFNLSSSGDQVFAYQGAAPTAGDESNFLAAIQMNGSWDSSVDGSNASNESTQPSVFTDGETSLSINPEIDNAWYDCSVTSGDAETLRQAINDANNWNTNNSNSQLLSGCDLTVNTPSVTLSLVSGLGSGAAFPAGVSTEVWMATDPSGNTDECSFTITVKEPTPPTISCLGTRQKRSPDADACGYTVQGTEFDPVAHNDNCPNWTISNDFNGQNTLDGAFIPKGGVTTITWTATDASGNTASCSFEVKVTKDVSPPMFVACPDDTTIKVSFGTTGSTFYWDQSVLDNCTATNKILLSGFPLNNSFFATGTTTPVAYEAEDKKGNTSTCEFDVTVMADCDPLPAGFSGTTVCSGSGTGDHCYDVGTDSYKVSTNSSIIWNRSDCFHYVYQQLNQDAEIVARIIVPNLSSHWNQAGVMIRGSLATNSAHVSTLGTGDRRAIAAIRPFNNSVTLGYTGPTYASYPIWVKIKRVGFVFTTSASADGVTWTVISSGSAAIGYPYCIGLVSSTYTPGYTGLFEFDNVTINSGAGTRFAYTGPVMDFEAIAKDMTSSVMFGEELSLTAYPNPFQKQLQLAGTAPEGVSSMKLQLTNSIGQVIWRKEVAIDETRLIMEDIQVPELPAGIYFVEARTELETKTIKLVKK